MKNLVFGAVALLAFPAFLRAQTPVYFLFDANCMNRLEYRHASQPSGTSVVTYAFAPERDQLYLFDMSAEDAQVYRTLPQGTVLCGNADLSDELVRNINRGAVRAWFLRPSANGGYAAASVTTAMQVVRSGAFYIFRGSAFDFVLDTTNLNYNENIASRESRALIYYNGRNMDGCHPVYTFRREPDQNFTTKTDFDFMPGLGILSERTGATAAEASANEYRLATVNGWKYADFVQASCAGRRPERETQPLGTQAVTYGTTAPPRQNVVRNVAEPDKETAAATQSPALAPAEYGRPSSGALPAGFVGPRPLINCPEQPGEGYHIVQPGQTLMGISRAYRVRLGSLVAWNSLEDPDVLQPCQKIYIAPPPGGVKTPKDKSTGKVAIAKKPNAKSSKTSQNPTAPATYSTESLVARGEAVQPQNIYWTGTTSAPAAGTVQYVYVPVAAQPAQYDAQPAASPARQTAKSAAATSIHVVRVGESLYSIAQLYGYTVERFRKINNLPENFALQPGMQLATSDCACDTATGQPIEPATYSQPQRTGLNTPAATSREATNPRRGEVFEEVQLAPTTYSTQKSSNAGAKTFIEHTVQVGESLGSIANRYGVSAERIAETNSLEKTETLIVGMRLMVPVR